MYKIFIIVIIIASFKILFVWSVNTKRSNTEEQQEDTDTNGWHTSINNVDIDGNLTERFTEVSIYDSIIPGSKNIKLFSPYIYYLKSSNSSRGIEKNTTTFKDSSGKYHFRPVDSVSLRDMENIAFKEKKREDAYVVTTPKDNPYALLVMAFIAEQPRNLSACTGTLLTDEWILTAAHCFIVNGYNADGVIVYAGGNSMTDTNITGNGKQIGISTNFYPHPKYVENIYYYDVGVVKLNRKFNLTETVNVAKLSTSPWTHYSYRNCSFTGFGAVVDLVQKHKDDYFRKTHVMQVKQPCLCSDRLQLIFGSTEVGRLICSSLKEDYGFCGGDSGAGLICDGEVKAVASAMFLVTDKESCSWGSPHNLKCATEQTLNIFQDVCPTLRWINGYVKLYEDKDIHPDCVDGGTSSKTSLALVVTVFFINITSYMK